MAAAGRAQSGAAGRRRGGLLAGAALVALMAAGALGCAERDLGRVGAHVYPPDFHYITRDELEGSMSELARDVDALDAILARASGPQPADRAAAIEILERMHAHAHVLGRGRDSNHPQLQDGAERFERDVDRALNGVRRDPPDFTWAARLAGGCTACHAPRHDPRPPAAG